VRVLCHQPPVAIPPDPSGQVPPAASGSGSAANTRRRNPTVLLWSIPTSSTTKPKPTDSSVSQSNRTHLINSHRGDHRLWQGRFWRVAIPPYSSGQCPPGLAMGKVGTHDNSAMSQSHRTHLVNAHGGVLPPDQGYGRGEVAIPQYSSSQFPRFSIRRARGG
jgi:hypothetical protein